MNDAAGGIAVTVCRDRRSPGRWAVYGPGARRIGEVRPDGGATTCWWALGRDGAVLEHAATFGATVGLVVDAEVEMRGPKPADDRPGRRGTGGAGLAPPGSLW